MLEKDRLHACFASIDFNTRVVKFNKLFRNGWGKLRSKQFNYFILNHER